jgi:hypothetical protein
MKRKSKNLKQELSCYGKKVKTTSISITEQHRTILKNALKSERFLSQSDVVRFCINNSINKLR